MVGTFLFWKMVSGQLRLSQGTSLIFFLSIQDLILVFSFTSLDADHSTLLQIHPKLLTHRSLAEPSQLSLLRVFYLPLLPPSACSLSGENGSGDERTLKQGRGTIKNMWFLSPSLDMVALSETAGVSNGKLGPLRTLPVLAPKETQ